MVVRKLNTHTKKEISSTFRNFMLFSRLISDTSLQNIRVPINALVVHN